MKKITFPAVDSRLLGLLTDDAEAKRQIEEWVSEDHAKLLMLCKRYGIQDGPAMFYQLALELARKLYPKPKKPGRKSKWTMLAKGALVVEVDRLVKPGDQSHGVEWACGVLAKREPWASFIEAKENGTDGPDPAEALRQVYFEFRADKWAEVFRKASKWHEHEKTMAELDSMVPDFVRNTLPK